jgi:hypothetical protein
VGETFLHEGTHVGVIAKQVARSDQKIDKIELAGMGFQGFVRSDETL